MSIIQWGINFYTGLNDVDSQHQRLVALTNHLSEVSPNQPEALDHAFNELREYAKMHFSLEETMMEEAGVDPEHFRYHKNAHQLFVSKITELWSARDDSADETLDQLNVFLITWILQHILQTDQKMALEIHARLGSKAPHNMFTHF